MMTIARDRRRLCFVSRNNVGDTPYYDIALPCLSRNGWQIDVFAPAASQSVLRRTIGYESTSHDIPSGPRLAHELAVARALLRARLGRYDVVYLCGHFLAARGRVLMAGPRFGPRLVYHNTDYFDPVRFPWQARLEAALSRKANLNVNDEYHRGYITQTYYGIRGPILVLPPNLPAAWPIPARSAEIRKELDGGNPGAFVIMNCGGYSPLRMIPHLCEALARLPSFVRLALTGGVPASEKVRGHLRHLGIEGRVTWLPFLPFAKMVEYLANADAGVLLVANTDLGNYFGAEGRLTQYLACGLPILASPHAGIESLVRRHEIGETVAGYDAAALVKSIHALIDKVRAGVLSRERIRSVFREQLAFERWEPLIVRAFEGLSGREPGRPGLSPSLPWMLDV
jgi:glycosyltransferase involved in cell wall biosynthesis